MILSEDFFPGGRTYLSLIGVVAIFVHLKCLDGVENQLGIHIPANLAFSHPGIDLVVGLFKMNYRFHRVAVINQPATLVQNHHAVEHFIQLRRWLVDYHKYQAALEG